MLIQTIFVGIIHFEWTKTLWLADKYSPEFLKSISITAKQHYGYFSAFSGRVQAALLWYGREPFFTLRHTHRHWKYPSSRIEQKRFEGPATPFQLHSDQNRHTFHASNNFSVPTFVWSWRAILPKSNSGCRRDAGVSSKRFLWFVWLRANYFYNHLSASACLVANPIVKPSLRLVVHTMLVPIFSMRSSEGAVPEPVRIICAIFIFPEREGRE